MKLSDLTAAELDHAANAVHEAAHAVMAVLAGADVLSCVASGADGRVEFHGHDPERAAGIGWAGPYAELLFLHRGQPSEAAVREAFAAASDEDRDLMGRRAARHVEADVRFAMPAIRRLAVKLHRTGTVRSPDIHLALGVRPGVDIDTVRWAHKQRIDPFAIRPAGAAA
ncbi:hypothetical protein [Nocardia vermiculata]|uniref:Peptidase M41 domain-containing protein n=1 Tax=Nocardia vermiculata TaxID=257274 RepID=A0A846XWT0_9NOCA|nr:hypothetical protein [Nocardia vermiculata]NKY50174.1 hypothetical protein [Nocardia vermiculata]